MDATSAQVKLATKLHKHKIANATRNPLKPVADLPLSTEMIALLEQTLEPDEDGYLPETVGSHLSMPLSAISVYCPTAAVLASKHTAARLPSPTGKLSRSSRSPFTPSGTGTLHLEGAEQISPTTRNDSFRSETDGINLTMPSPFSPAPTSATSFSGRGTPYSSSAPGSETKPKINEAKSRLDVLWLRRKAELAQEDGDFKQSFNLLQEALDEHLGGRDYKKARLSEPVVSSDPVELLSTIRNEYFLFDTYAHKMAGVVQRWYHRKHAKRCDAITTITRIFRGFKHRHALKKYREMRRQCAVLLQRRFRKHLIRMHALATLIKRWYKLRRIVKAFQKRLHIYRMARRIQALYRGYLGRLRAGLKKRQFQLVNRIQRTARAYIVRRNRAYVLSLFHQRFWKAARVIQTTMRRVQAIERCQIKLLLELSRENIRARKEKIVVEEALRMQKIKNSYYFRTDAGSVHLGLVQRQAVVKKLNMKALAPVLTEEQQSTAKLVSLLELYDVDGTGNVPTRALHKVLRRALIVVNREQLVALRHRLDPEGTGQVAFTDFIDWYHCPAADAVIEPDSLLANLAMVQLQLRNQVHRLSFAHKLGAARKLLNAQHAAWLTKDTVSTFRITHAPKYQCCQCRAAFVMFTDYYAHFELDSGICGVTGERALFFPRYWVKQDWFRQRAIEREVIRGNDEQPFISFQCRLAACADLVHQGHPAVSEATVALITKATDLVTQEVRDVTKAKLKKFSVERLRGLFDTLQCVSVPDVVAERLTKALCLPFSKQWITDELAQANDVAKWLSKYITGRCLW
jgi:predicted metal-dependent hydrolase